MKRIKLYMIMIVSVAVLSFSCDPLEDEIKEIEASRVEVQDLVYTLVEDDYDFTDDICGCSRFGSFSSDEDVKSNVPLVLIENFPALGKGSSAIVTYKLFNGSSPDLRGDLQEFTVTDTEYDALGFGFGNFSNLSRDIPKYSEFKWPDAGDGDYMDITHDFFSGATGFVPDTVSRAVYTVSNGWQHAFILPEDAYGDFFGESGIDFSNSNEGKDKMPAYLNYLLSIADNLNDLSPEEGETMVVQFNFDDRCFEDPDTEAIECPDGPGLPNVPDVGLYIFTNGEWLLYNDFFQTAPATLSFGHDGTTWVPDNTIKYTFSTADFAVAGDDANELGNAAARANLRTFGNFGTQWSRDEVIGAIAFVLKKNFGGAEVGQKYLVTYNTFPAGDLSALFILDASGDYIEVVE